jgi:hypothetical protein
MYILWVKSNWSIPHVPGIRDQGYTYISMNCKETNMTSFDGISKTEVYIIFIFTILQHLPFVFSHKFLNFYEDYHFVNRKMMLQQMFTISMHINTLNKRPMGHIAYLSNLGPQRNIFAFPSHLPHPTLGGHDLNQLAFVLICQKAFM